MTGRRRSTTNCSARCCRNAVNLCARMRSISSLCLIRIDTLVELIDGSINVDSLSVRVMVIGVRRSSLLLRSSTSGRLCRSTVCEGKFRKQRAASRVDLMHVKYGRSVFACRGTEGTARSVVNLIVLQLYHHTEHGLAHSTAIPGRCAVITAAPSGTHSPSLQPENTGSRRSYVSKQLKETFWIRERTI